MPSRNRETTVSMPLTPTRSDLYWRRIFNKYDKDNDGRISYVELREIIESREYDHDLPDNVVDKIMNVADRDNSGYLDFQEFVEMMHNPDLKAVFGHFVARYVHSIVPHRNPVDTTDRHRHPQNIDTGFHEARLRTARPIIVMLQTSPQRASSSYTSSSSSSDSHQPSRARNNFINTDSQTPSRRSTSSSNGSYEEEYTCWPPAICMVLISLVEIILFVYDATKGHTTGAGPVAQLFIYNPHRRKEAWRFITYMFVHVGVVHLLVNLLVQLFLGVPLEMVHRWWRVVLVYLAGVAAGSLATSLTDPTVYLAGASGGVYALIAAHIATIIMNWNEMEFALLQLLIFILIAVVDVGTAVYERYWLHLQTNIGYVAHLAGAIAGLLVGIGVLRNLEKRKWEKRLWWMAVVLYFSLMIGGILANVFWTERFMEQYV